PADQHQPDAVRQGRRYRVPADVVPAALQQLGEEADRLRARDQPREGVLAGEDQGQQEQGDQQLGRHRHEPGERHPAGRRPHARLHGQQERRLHQPGGRPDQGQQGARREQRGPPRRQRQPYPPAHHGPSPPFAAASPERSRSASRHSSSRAAPRGTPTAVQPASRNRRRVSPLPADGPGPPAGSRRQLSRSSTKARAPPLRCRIRAHTAACSSSRPPRNATSRPSLPPRSTSYARDRPAPSEWSTTARVSIISPAASADSWPAPANPSEPSPGTALPVSVSSRTEKPRSSMCTSTEAAPDTAHSKAESGPAPS